jgi:hypothetical protein
MPNTDPSAGARARYPHDLHPPFLAAIGVAPGDFAENGRYRVLQILGP